MRLRKFEQAGPGLSLGRYLVAVAGDECDSNVT